MIKIGHDVDMVLEAEGAHGVACDPAQDADPGKPHRNIEEKKVSQRRAC
jgi:hypothetical protein